MSDGSRHVVVIGAGIVGAATAHALVQAGHKVTVLEAQATPGQGTSKANGAQLSYSYVEPLATPATLRKLPSMLLDPDSPLKFRPKADVGQFSWGLQFLKACNAPQVARTTEALLQLANLSRQELHGLDLNQPHWQFGHATPGKLVVHDTEAGLQSAQAQVLYQRRLGCEQTLLSVDECVAREPALAPYAAHIKGGVWTPSEAVGDCEQLTQALLKQACAHGAQLMVHSPVTGWECKGGRIMAVKTPQYTWSADVFVVANGVSAGALVQSLGLRLPIYPIKGYSITLPLLDPSKAPVASVTDLRRKTVYARLHHHLRVAGMAELVGYDTQLDMKRIRFLQRCVEETFPGACDMSADPQAWAGLRPATPTSMPLIGPARATGLSNLLLNVGHGSLGFTLAMGSARLLANWVGGPPHALAPLFLA